MHLDKTQLGVAKGMASALLAAILVFVAAQAATPTISETVDLGPRLKIATLSLLLPALTLLFCIARLARHRFFTPEDINGSAQTSGTQGAQILQSLLQNTLEQCSLALPCLARLCCGVTPCSRSLAGACSGRCGDVPGWARAFLRRLRQRCACKSLRLCAYVLPDGDAADPRCCCRCGLCKCRLTHKARSCEGCVARSKPFVRRAGP